MQSQSGGRTGPAGIPRISIAAFITALAGIPFFGAVTGLVAMLLGCLALGAPPAGTKRRGTVLAVFGIVHALILIWFRGRALRA